MSPACEAMVVTDLDGTLLDSRGRLSPVNNATLEALGAAAILRVVATGRSLWSALKVIGADTPLDYLVFASGAGIVNWPERDLLHARHLSRGEALTAAAVLRELDCDFMLHQSVPDNHHFWYHRGRLHNPDFDRRIDRYRPFCQPWPETPLAGDAFSQLLVIEAADDPGVDQPRLSGALAPLSVIRTTSPLDQRSHWFEIFPPRVSKASGIEWLAARHGLEAAAVLAIGNDYNDVEMLEWARDSLVVANAPAELCRRFETVPANDANGFSIAVRAWLARG